MRPGKLKKIVLVAGAVWLILLCVAGFFLFRCISRFRHEENDLKMARRELDRFYERNPFPSLPNVEQETTNLVSLTNQFNAFLSGLSKGQPGIGKETPAAFMGSFWQTQKELLRQAKASAVDVPGDFKFGFAAYGGGELPVAQDVPGLALQLDIVTNLCSMLYECRIKELRQVVRESFDTASARAATVGGGGRRGGAPETIMAAPAGGNVNIGVVPPGALYTPLHFNLEFSGSEAAVMAVLNRFARSSLFVVVTKLELVAEDAVVAHAAKPVTPRGAAAAETPAPKEEALKSDRIVSGQEKPMTVKMELDVYRFSKGTDA